MGLFDRMKVPAAKDTTVSDELERVTSSHWRNLILGIVIIVLLILFRDTLGLGKGIEVTTDQIDTQLGVVDIDGNVHTFDYSDVKSVALRTDLKRFDRGELIDGQENWLVRSGTYRNGEYGEYGLYVMRRLKSFIVVETGDGVIAFNLESDDTTESLYDYLVKQTG